jgi:hypothetical protein
MGLTSRTVNQTRRPSDVVKSSRCRGRDGPHPRVGPGGVWRRGQRIGHLHRRARGFRVPSGRRAYDGCIKGQLAGASVPSPRMLSNRVNVPGDSLIATLRVRRCWHVVLSRSSAGSESWGACGVRVNRRLQFLGKICSVSCWLDWVGNGWRLARAALFDHHRIYDMAGDYSIDARFMPDSGVSHMLGSAIGKRRPLVVVGTIRTNRPLSPACHGKSGRSRVSIRS